MKLGEALLRVQQIDEQLEVEKGFLLNTSLSSLQLHLSKCDELIRERQILSERIFLTKEEIILSSNVGSLRAAESSLEVVKEKLSVLRNACQVSSSLNESLTKLYKAMHDLERGLYVRYWEVDLLEVES